MKPFQAHALTPTRVSAERTIYLKGKFLGLAVVAVLLQVADCEFLQWKSSLYRETTQKRGNLPFIPFTVMLELS